VLPLRADGGASPACGAGSGVPVAAASSASVASHAPSVRQPCVVHTCEQAQHDNGSVASETVPRFLPSSNKQQQSASIRTQRLFMRTRPLSSAYSSAGEGGASTATACASAAALGGAASGGAALACCFQENMRGAAPSATHCEQARARVQSWSARCSAGAASRGQKVR
jgi:hypothetical protein